MSKHRVKRNLTHAAAAASAAMLSMLAGVARAQLVYDPFNYTAASSLDAKVNPIDGQPWSVMSNNGADDDIIVNAGNISYTGLAAPIGNSVGFASTGKSERLGFDQTVRAGTLYYSSVFRVTSLGSLTTNPVFIGGFSDRSGTSGSPPTTVGARLYLRVASTSAPGAERFDIGVSKNSGFDIDWDDDNHYALNTPIFVVGSYQVVGGGAGTDDVAGMWINPAASSLGAASAPTTSTIASPILNAPVVGTDLTVSGVPSLAGFVLRQGTGVPAVQLDELRVDTSWARVTPPTGATWSFAGDGAWSEPGKWSTSASPSSPDAFVNFNSQAAPRAVTVDTAVQLRSMTIDSSQGYTFAAGAGGSLDFSGAGGINVRGSGTHTINASVTVAGESLVSVATASTLNLGGDFAGGNNAFTKSGDGALSMKHLRAGATNLVAGTVRITQDGGPTGASRVASLVVNAGSSLDLSDNDLVIDYTGASPIGTATAEVYSGVSGMIAAARNGGAWDGPTGIRTSRPDALSGLTDLGIGEASSILGLGPGDTAIWSGRIVDDTSVLVRYTYGGDANLDGIVSGDDYAAIDFNIAVPNASGWSNGDFNYDGIISGDDYATIDFNIVAQGAPLGDAGPHRSLGGGVTTVPEPASPIALALTTIAGRLLRRRRSESSTRSLA